MAHRRNVREVAMYHNVIVGPGFPEHHLCFAAEPWGPLLHFLRENHWQKTPTGYRKFCLENEATRLVAKLIDAGYVVGTDVLLCRPVEITPEALEATRKREALETLGITEQQYKRASALTDSVVAAVRELGE